MLPRESSDPLQATGQQAEVPEVCRAALLREREKNKKGRREKREREREKRQFVRPLHMGVALSPLCAFDAHTFV